MPNENKEQQVSLELYTKANDESANLRAEAKTKDAELATAAAKVSELKAQAANIASALSKGSQELDALLPGFSAKVDGNPESFFSVLSEALTKSQAVKDELQKQLDESLAKVGEIELAARTAARGTKIDSLLGVAAEDDAEKKKKDKEKKDKMMAAVSELTDEQFNSLFEVWAEDRAEAKKPAFLEKKDEKDEKDGKKDEKDAKAGPGKKFASVEETVREVLAGMAKASTKEIDVEELIEATSGHKEASDEDNLMALLDNVKASEKTPSAGEEVAQGVDLTSSFGSLVNTMLGRDNEENN